MYQRFGVLLIIGIVLLSTTAVAANGDAITGGTTSDGFRYSAIDNGTAVGITGYAGPGGSVVIPSMIDGKPVVSIGDLAFIYCNMTSVTIPDSVISIGNYSFYQCLSLTSVTIGNGVTNIGKYSFDFCENLTSVSIGNNVTNIGSYAFSFCTSLNVHRDPETTSPVSGMGLSMTVGPYPRSPFLMVSKA